MPRCFRLIDPLCSESPRFFQHLAHENRALAGHVGHLAAQLQGPLGYAKDAAEIEEDVGELDGDGIAATAPELDLFAPLTAGFAPERIARHDVAPAERKPHGVQVAVEALGQLDEIGIDASVVRVGVVLQDHAVVLIWVEIILAAAARAHDDEAEIDRLPAAALALQSGDVVLDQPMVDVAVHVADEA